MYKKILVPLDDLALAEAVLPYARCFPTLEAATKRICIYENAIAERVNVQGIQNSLILRETSTGEAILAVADAIGVDTP